MCVQENSGIVGVGLALLSSERRFFEQEKDVLYVQQYDIEPLLILLYKSLLDFLEAHNLEAEDEKI